MVAVPALLAVERPELAMVAADVLLEVHVTELVTLFVEPSLYVPVAVNCCVPPAAREAEDGVTEIALSVAPVTVSAAEPVIDPEVA
jgi:hypothetical protein